MTESRFPRHFAALRYGRFALVAALAGLMLALAACGSTKVYTADKTIVYNGAIFNVSNVQRISSRSEAELPNGQTVNLRGMDRKGIEALLDEHGSMVVTNVVEMDTQEMVYQRAKVEKYSQYSKMAKNFDSAQKNITKFVADKKKTQLKL